MSRISQIDYAAATPEARAEHDREMQLRGRMTNMKRIMLHSPAARHIYAEWFTLRDLLRPPLTDRAIWLFCLAVSEAREALVPATFFRRALIDAGLQPETTAASPDEAALVAFGKALAADSKSVSDDLWEPLATRYDEATLVNLVAFAGIMVATTIFTNVVEVDLDAELEPYRAPDTGISS